MLWFMRRPAIKRLQQKSTEIGTPHFRAYAKNSLLKQNSFARRFGRTILYYAYLTLLASIVVTTVFRICLAIYESGALSAGENLVR